MEQRVKGQAEGGAVKRHPHTSQSTAQFTAEDGRASARGEESGGQPESQTVPQKVFGSADSLRQTIHHHHRHRRHCSAMSF